MKYKISKLLSFDNTFNRMNYKLIISCFIIVIATSCSKKDERMSETNTPPIAVKKNTVLEKHGDKRIDPYFWLKDRENPEVINYLKAENEYYQKMTAHTKDFQKELFEEMKGRIKEDDESVPYLYNGYYYITRYETGKDYPIYARKKGSLEAVEEILGEGGVKNLAIKTILPGLNANIAALSQTMHLSFQLKFNEKFDCVITHLGQEINAMTLSTGERKKADFVIIISIIKILKLRFPQLNLLFLDELLSSVDQDGIYNILKILSQVIKESKINTFVINHTPLPHEIFDKKLHIFKENGFSKFEIEAIE